jgi:hypothetical protein
MSLASIEELLAPYLEPGETPLHAAVGVPTGQAAPALASSVALLTGNSRLRGLAVLFEKRYLIALTDRRLIALAVKGEGFSDVRRDEQHSVTFKKSGLEVALTVSMPSVGFDECLQLNPLHLERNVARAEALAAASTTNTAAAAPFPLSAVPFAAWRRMWMILWLATVAMIVVVIVIVIVGRS